VTKKLIRKAATYAQRAIILLASQYGTTPSTQHLANKHSPKPAPGAISLDLGCGGNPKNPFQASKVYGVDIRNGLGNDIKQADLAKEQIPFSDNSLDFCTAYDFIEHIPRMIETNGKTRLSFIELMNEVHRVLKPNGLFLHTTPAFPAKAAFQDPTHVNIITEDTFPEYFTSPRPGASIYGFKGNFELVDQKWKSMTWLICLLRAVE
jgi:SAM-dependent methyltransferase